MGELACTDIAQNNLLFKILYDNELEWYNDRQSIFKAVYRV